MQVFISWSGEESQRVAELLRDWLPDVIQAVNPWVSAKDIDKGEGWFLAIQDSLKEAQGYGIFCVTADNLTSPWLAFEAGALAMADKGRVATFLHNVEPTAIRPPLGLFQATRGLDKEDVFLLLQSINGRLSQKLTEKQLEKAFETHWPVLELNLKGVKVEKPVEVTKKTNLEVTVEEVLNSVRRVEKALNTPQMRDLGFGGLWSPGFPREGIASLLGTAPAVTAPGEMFATNTTGSHGIQLKAESSESAPPSKLGIGLKVGGGAGDALIFKKPGV